MEDTAGVHCCMLRFSAKSAYNGGLTPFSACVILTHAACPVTEQLRI